MIQFESAVIYVSWRYRISMSRDILHSLESEKVQCAMKTAAEITWENGVIERGMLIPRFNNEAGSQSLCHTYQTYRIQTP